MGSGESYKQWAISSRSGKKHPIFFFISSFFSLCIFCIFFLVFSIPFFFFFFYIFFPIFYLPPGKQTGA
ncbi:hypothetical protein VN97_g414 [Penicillium thymicola]|uniref:Uncharacterized protein n=1 Tax=Penicillium thymicola TaxID=293382 RepID=A0AAI9XDM9_PENTH|nr:hypothetical protein VN97_g414 [Penicillium thymicola]